MRRLLYEITHRPTGTPSVRIWVAQGFRCAEIDWPQALRRRDIFQRLSGPTEVGPSQYSPQESFSRTLLKSSPPKTCLNQSLYGWAEAHPFQNEYRSICVTTPLRVEAPELLSRENPSRSLFTSTYGWAEAHPFQNECLAIRVPERAFLLPFSHVQKLPKFPPKPVNHCL